MRIRVRAEKPGLEARQKRLEEWDGSGHDTGDLDDLSTDNNWPDGVERIRIRGEGLDVANLDGGGYNDTVHQFISHNLVMTQTKMTYITRDQKPTRSVVRTVEEICNGITINVGMIASARSVVMFINALYVRIARCIPSAFQTFTRSEEAVLQCPCIVYLLCPISAAADTETR